MPIDAGPFVRAREVGATDALVSIDPEIMGGAPCFTGTRVPIDTVLASLGKGIGTEDLRESFRFLTDAHLSAARVHAAVHPRRGRPQSLGEMNPLSSRVVRPARDRRAGRLAINYYVDFPYISTCSVFAVGDRPDPSPLLTA